MKPSSTLLALVLALASGAQAQTASAPAGAASAGATSAAKKALIAKVLQLQQPGIETMARQLAEQPALQMLQQAATALQRVPADKREAVAKDIQADARKYAEEAGPIARDRAVKLAPTTIGPLLEERFSEAELRQVVALLESPINLKYQALGGEMQRSLVEKLIPDIRGTLEPRLKSLDQAVGKRLAAASAAASAPKP